MKAIGKQNCLDSNTFSVMYEAAEHYSYCISELRCLTGFEHHTLAGSPAPQISQTLSGLSLHPPLHTNPGKKFNLTLCFL